MRWCAVVGSGGGVRLNLSEYVRVWFYCAVCMCVFFLFRLFFRTTGFGAFLFGVSRNYFGAESIVGGVGYPTQEDGGTQTNDKGVLAAE